MLYVIRRVVYSAAMPRVAPTITLNPVSHDMLHHLVRSPSTPQALALRCRIVLAAAAGQSNQAIAAGLHIPEVTAGKWRRAFASAGLDGLRDAPRPGRPPKHGIRKIAELWELSESAEKVLAKEWVENRVIGQIYGLTLSEEERERLELFRSSRKAERDNKDNFNVEVMVAEEEGKIPELQQIREKLKEKGAGLLPLTMAKNRHIYLDVTEIEYKTFCSAYSAIRLLRDRLGIENRAIKRGAPESIDEFRAVLAVKLELLGLTRREIAEALRFKI